MKLTKEQIRNLTHLLSVTKEEEINCNECLSHVAEYAECELSGVPLPDALEQVKQHLSLCTECREEYETLLDVLTTMASQDD